MRPRSLFSLLRLLVFAGGILFGSHRAPAIDAPANPNASPEVRALLAYMESIHGTHILSGQQEFPDWPWNDADEDETEYLERVTGKLPAVRGFDFIFYTHSPNGRASMQVTERAIAWAQRGGIVTFCLHWMMDVDSPNGPAFYTSSGSTTQFTNFDIRQAIIAGTPENAEFIAEMDIIAEELKKLRDAGVPVIWRPFHEEGGAWFWWSRHGAAPFLTAWRMMFDRFTNLHQLDNLIWEFNPNNLTILTSWYPGDAYVDMISLDIYPDSGHPVHANEYNQYWNFTNGRKLVALSENGRIPDPDQLTAQNAHWVYFCTWDGVFINTDTYNDLAFKQTVFNHARVLTLDELPKVHLWGRTPQFTAHPASATLAVGAGVTLSAAADANEAITYQWFRNGTAISGQTTATLDLTNLQAGDSGIYTVQATTSIGTNTSRASAIVVGDRVGRLANLSTRGLVNLGDDVMIAGFVVGGTSTRTLLVRAVGPKLIEYGVTGALANPQMAIVNNLTSATIMTNDDWETQLGGLPAVAPVASAVSAFALDAASTDASLVGTFDPGAYTAIVSGVGETTGIALAEVYDAGGNDATSRLVNISTRGFVGTGGSIMIPGVVVSQTGRRLLIRGIGPGIDAFVNSPVLPDPVVQVVDNAGNVIFENDDWGSVATSPAVAAAFTATSAFGIADGSGDAALVIDLPPGLFTVLVTGKDGATGVALVEVYEMAP